MRSMNGDMRCTIGSGQVTRMTPARSRPPVILEFARNKARAAGYSNVETSAVDGESLKVGAGVFDAAICRLGLMFFPNPGKGLREMYRALKPGGRACTMVFSSPDNNPCVSILVSTAFKYAGLAPRDPYQPGGLLSLGKPGLIEDVFQQAGFSRVATTKLAAPFTAVGEGLSRLYPQLGQPHLADPRPTRRVRETGRLGGNRNQAERLQYA